MSRNVLLLTATINPSARILPATARSDPDQRRRDYEKALSFYTTLLGRCFDGIVFCENSGADLGSLREVGRQAGRAGPVELLSYKADEPPPHFGKAYAEISLIEHARANSEQLAVVEDTIVWKCTGRYIIHNMEKLIVERPRSFDFYCHKRDRPYPLCELYLMAWNEKGYQAALAGAAPKLLEHPGERRMPETFFRQHIDELGKEIKVVPRFRHVPLIEASRGWNNQPYSWRRWQPRILVREAAGWLAPWLWI